MPLPLRLTDNVLFVQIMSRFSPPPPYFSLPVIQVQVNERLFPEHMLIINVNDNNSITEPGKWLRLLLVTEKKNITKTTMKYFEGTRLTWQ